jgi:hypothetical protein
MKVRSASAFSSSSPAAPANCVPLGCQAPAPRLPWLTTTAGRSDATLPALLLLALMFAVPALSGGVALGSPVESVKLDCVPAVSWAVNLLLAK